MLITNFKEKVYNCIEFLPPIPDIMKELNELLQKKDCDLRDISGVIEKDPSLSLNVLKIANSAFYGLPYEVSSMERAVALIGLQEVASLCMVCNITDILKPEPGVMTMDIKSFWEHSVATGVIAKIFCKEFNIRTQENLYLAGLIHDVGKIIIDRFSHIAYDGIIKATHDENIALIEAEKRIIGESHDRVGGWLIEKWELPKVFFEVAAHHHSLMDASDGNRRAVAIISLSNHIARIKGFGFGGDMRGIILQETDAFRIINAEYPHLRDQDIARFVMDLDRADNEIAGLERMMNAGSRPKTYRR
ncbi:MAG: HDOD domain-containing protein [Nitrospirae bacterium]|nr:HDOD domain-containing protein [Nitrospirota bacterium]